MLPYTQEEVKDHKAEKSKAKAERDAKQPLRRKWVAKGQKTGNLGRMAERHFGNIWHLIEMRQDKRRKVEQGHREFCVYWRMNFVVQSGRVMNLAEFDALTQMLIDKNGLQFRSECSVSKLTTLRGSFARGGNVYKAKTATLMDDLGISLREQEELEVLREFSKREKKTTHPKAPLLERLKLWEVEGILRRVW